jgi:dihydrofolate synthase/folylpolyglutamate synthase
MLKWHLFNCHEKWPNDGMIFEFNEIIESELLDFIQKHYGLEVFTPGLERTRPLYFPFVKKIKEAKTKVTIIAGTNGKGQTAHTLAYFLEQSECRVALWTSPHILSLRERFYFNNGDVAYDKLSKEIYQTHDYLKKDHPGLLVSFYEFLFLVFLRLSLNSETPLDHLILEVGLGGRLDAVNHFDADCMCITSISRDHQMILGNRFDLILSEKIAVSRANRPLFTNFKLDYLNQLTKKYCEEHRVLWRPINDSGLEDSSDNYFLENQELARSLFCHLEPLREIAFECEVPTFKGRREEMTFNGNTLIFIGAHNIDGVRRMIELFSPQESSSLPNQLLVSFSKRPLSEVEIMLKTMVDFFGNDAKLSLTSFVHPKALELSAINELENKFNKINKGLLDFVTDWKTDLKKSKNQKILVCGSYYFVGEVQRFLHS